MEQLRLLLHKPFGLQSTAKMLRRNLDNIPTRMGKLLRAFKKLGLTLARIRQLPEDVLNLMSFLL